MTVHVTQKIRMRQTRDADDAESAGATRNTPSHRRRHAQEAREVKMKHGVSQSQHKVQRVHDEDTGGA